MPSNNLYVHLLYSLLVLLFKGPDASKTSVAVPFGLDASKTSVVVPLGIAFVLLICAGLGLAYYKFV